MNILLYPLMFILLLVFQSSEFHGLPASKKLNVLFIAVDDLRPQLGAYGVEDIITPNIDRLADEGLLFQRAYAQEAICGASRISMLTGMRCESTRIYGIKLKKKEILPDIVSLPEHFKNNGYETISIGKIYHHADDDLKAWTKEPYRAMKGSGYVTDEGFEKVRLNQQLNKNAGTKGPVSEQADVEDNIYSDGKLTDKVIYELNHLNKDKPFFLAVGFRKPHLPFIVPKKYWDMYDPQKLEIADNPFFPKNFTKFTMNNYGELRNYYAMPKGKDPVDDKLARHLIHGYYSCVTFIDYQIGKILDELDKLDLRKNTIVILWGDHGWKLGEHKSWCKHTNFEIDTRAPLIISVPGMQNAGQQTEALTEFVDIYPSLSQLCDLPLPGHLEGTSFLPVLENPDRKWKDAAFSVWVNKKYRYDEEIQIIGYAMRTDRYRYIEWRRTKTGEILARELYDHKVDAQENENVADDPEYSDVVVTLSEKMKGGWKEALPKD